MERSGRQQTNRPIFVDVILQAAGARAEANQGKANDF